MRTPCDTGVQSAAGGVPCRAENKAWILAATILGSSMAFIDSTVVNVALPAIQTSFNAKVVGVQWVVESYGRFLAPLMLVGGWLVEHAYWRWAFFINLPLAAAVIAISLWRIPESRSATADRVDWLGALLATLGLGGIVNGFIESANLGWRNPLVFGSLIAGFGCMIGFALVEARATSPMVRLAMFKNASFTGANLLTLFLYSAIGIFFFLFRLSLIQVQGYSSTATGAAILPLILLMFVLSRWSGGLVTRYGARGPLIVGPVIAALGFVLFALPSTGGSYWTTFFPAIIVLGFGMAITVAPLTTVVMNSVDQDRVGAASGINNAVARVAGVLAIAVLGLVMVQAFSSRLNHSLTRLSLPAGTLHEIQAGEIKLAGLQAPANLDPGTRSAIEELIRQVFTFGFRIVILICSGMSLASAIVARMMIPREPDRLESSKRIR